MSLFLNRKSVRNYDENFKIPRNELNEMLELALRAPSSMNLQPTRMIVVESKEAKEKIKPHMFGNILQLDTSSAFIIIATDLNKFETGIKVFSDSEHLGFLPKEVANRQKDIIKERNNNYNKARILNEGYLDGGLLAMQLMLVAKEYGYDTCPIAGFNKQTILSALNIEDENLQPILIVSLGKAKDAGYDSYRISLDDAVKYY